MKCSLIIPAYNAENTIRTCLESALRQSLFKDRYEVIVVDDGSNDNTAEIVSTYAVKMVKQPNQGPAAARNKGAKASRGEILVFTDSDCELSFNFLENIIAPMKKNAKIVGVQGSYKTKQNDFMAQFGQVEIEIRYQKMAKTEYIDFIGTYAAAYNKSIFEQFGGFDQGFRLASGEDTEFSYKLQEAGHKMVFEPKAVVYHQHPTILTNYLKTKFNRGYWRIRLYRKHPKKTINDSYTPQSLKIQIMCIPFMLFIFLFSAINPFWIFGLFLIITLFGYWSMPFLDACINKNIFYYLFIPLVLVLRAISIFLGMVFGLIKEIKVGYRAILNNMT
jgi:glycosyltransferase involved in cell wall biosynthesis